VIPARAFEHWEPGRGWVSEPGTFRLEAGPSSRNLLVTAELTAQ